MSETNFMIFCKYMGEWCKGNCNLLYYNEFDHVIIWGGRVWLVEVFYLLLNIYSKNKSEFWLSSTLPEEIKNNKLCNSRFYYFSSRNSMRKPWPPCNGKEQLISSNFDTDFFVPFEIRNSLLFVNKWKNSKNSFAYHSRN